MKNFIIALLVIIIVVLGAWLLYYKKAEAPADILINNGTSSPATTTPTSTPVTTEPKQSGEGMIKISVPQKNQLITSPLTVTGEAKGGWYFEASAPVKILDANGKIIGQGPVQAQGDWMVSGFVPFKGTITFSAPTTSTGTVVFMNDNPSGLPENDRSYSVPVRFK